MFIVSTYHTVYYTFGWEKPYHCLPVADFVQSKLTQQPYAYIY